MKDFINNIKKKNHLSYLLILILILLIIFFSVGLFRNIHKNNIFTQRKNLLDFLGNHKTNISDVNYVESWMTFRYINTIFKLPEDYLKDKLNINDKKYPNIPLERYANYQKINQDIFLEQVKNSINNYLNKQK
ncbi:MAG: hypothetical protein PHE25_01700 [Candidatus Gracilibacteria bacterium]|nr:hypothetical protein [Candidatus Gracilibacteria bacterium]